jgi:hypothetical protein
LPDNNHPSIAQINEGSFGGRRQVGEDQHYDAEGLLVKSSRRKWIKIENGCI